MFRIFKLDSEKNLLINREEILAIPEFKRILTRHNPSKGDADGRKKLQAFKEFMFIYLYTDMTSPYIDREESQKFEISKKEAGISDDWSMDEDIRICINKYRELQDTFAIKSFIGLKQGLRISSTAIQLLNAQNEQMIKAMQSKIQASASMGIETNAADLIVYNDALIKNINTLNSLAETVSETLDNIEDYEKKIRKESRGKVKATGKRQIGNRELPPGQKMELEEDSDF